MKLVTEGILTNFQLNNDGCHVSLLNVRAYMCTFSQVILCL